MSSGLQLPQQLLLTLPKVKRSVRRLNPHMLAVLIRFFNETWGPLIDLQLCNAYNWTIEYELNVWMVQPCLRALSIWRQWDLEGKLPV